MPTLIPIGYAQCSWNLDLNGDPEPIQITFGVSVDGAVTQATVNNLHAALKTTGTLLDQISNVYLSKSVTMYVGNASPAPPTVWVSDDATKAGGGAGAPLPQNCGVLITKRTGSAGRRNKGRWYVPGIGEGAVDAIGVVSAPTVTAFQTAANATLAAINAAVGIGNMVILHTSGGTTPPGDPSVVTSLQVQSKMATQRRRLRP